MSTTKSTVSLQGHLEHITYYSEETYFTIARFRIKKTRNLITILGHMPAPSLGEGLALTGRWETHPKFGQQLRIESYEIALPATVDGIRKYLASGCIKGIGPKMADRLIQHFQEQTLEVIENDPRRLLEVEGIGTAKASQINAQWHAQHGMRLVLNVLKAAGIKPGHGVKIIKKYGPEALRVIRETPYRLAMDFPRIGFYMADAIVQSSGAPVNESERVTACILYRLHDITEEGHCCIKEDELTAYCEKNFSIDSAAVQNGLRELVKERAIVVEPNPASGAPGLIFLRTLWEAETGIANRIKAMLSLPVAVPPIDPQWIVEEILNKFAVKLSEEQLAVLNGILAHRVAIITGGPGTGKTTLIRSVTTIFERLGKHIVLAAPTGRAARRLSEVTRKRASTIHKLLGYNQHDGGFEKNRDHPLDLDALIVDEASMVDLFLMHRLLDAVSVNSTVIWVGDVFQLPSVGPGTVLSDLIDSQAVKTFELKKIFRQAEESPIIVNAHRVRRGQRLDFSPAEESTGLSEFYFIEKQRPYDVVETIVTLCREKIPAAFHFDPLTHIQVLTPMHKGEVGTLNLNQVLQQALNPIAEKSHTSGIGFHSGDKVIHLKNNYQKDVFNGDIGRVSEINPSERCLTVVYDGRAVAYDFSELDELMLAYAISIHKSQGSEYPAVIIPLMMQHAALLQRNLLYTGITRGRHLVVLIGSQRALTLALKNDTPLHRNSRLSDRFSRP